MGAKPVRVVVAKVGLDGHDRGVKIIARAFRDAGFEVIYTGVFQTPETVVRTVVQEDAQVLGLSILSGAHLHYSAEIRRLLEQADAEDVLMLVGGTIPQRDVPALKEMGVAEVFRPGTPTGLVIEFVRAWLATREAAARG